jgi:flagellar biosynthesis protein FlhG
VFARDSFSVIVNSAASEKEAQRIFAQINTTCKKFLGFSLEYLGYIMGDQAVPRSIVKQEVLVLSSPQSVVARNCESIIGNMGHWMAN